MIQEVQYTPLMPQFPLVPAEAARHCFALWLFFLSGLVFVFRSLGLPLGRGIGTSCRVRRFGLVGTFAGRVFGWLCCICWWFVVAIVVVVVVVYLGVVVVVVVVVVLGVVVVVVALGEIRD